MRNFSAFVNQIDRSNKEHLYILYKILETAGFRVSNHLDNDKEPYIYVHKPINADPLLESLSFGGVRIYTRGKDIICYRPQNKSTTEPFGNTLELDIKGMFKDLVRESNKTAVGHRIIFYIIKEIKDFFSKSAAAEKETDNDSTMGAIVDSPNTNDYSNQVMSPHTNYGGAV